MSPVEQRPDNTHLLSHSCPTGSSLGPAEKKERLNEPETIYSFSPTFVFSQMSETLIAIIDVFLRLEETEGRRFSETNELSQHVQLIHVAGRRYYSESA